MFDHEIRPFLYEIPRDYRPDMRVPARIFANEEILRQIENDRSIWQLVNTTSLPGIERWALAMPDIHQGYGFPIGGVVATRPEDGVVSPGGVGYDINCGVRALLTPWSKADTEPYREVLLSELSRAIPCGVGKGTPRPLSRAEMDAVLNNGAPQIIDWDMGFEEDIGAIESSGRLSSARAELVSERAKERGKDQLGSLGSGNHFLEIQAVDEIFDQDLCKKWGIRIAQTVVMIHTGSRGVGHQTCTDYVRRMLQGLGKWGITLPDRELACAPLSSKEGTDYLAAMAACANFAWANRQRITHDVRKVFRKVMGPEAGRIRVLYDVAHNIAKMEKVKQGGREQLLCVHRKGATRAFPKDHPELSETYRQTGQPIIIPGSMGTCSFVLAADASVMEETFGTVCHGAGRCMSRTAAKKKISGAVLRQQLKKKGILVSCPENGGLAEEAPFAYKDVNTVVDVVSGAGLARKVARMIPVAVMKGG